MKGMKKAMRPLVGLVALAAAALVFGSCAGKGSAFAAYVPADAIMVGYAPNPQAFLTQADAFAKAAGLDTFTQGKALDQFLFGTLDQDPSKIGKLFDLKRPSGFYATGTSLEGMKPVFLLAVKDGAAAKAWLEGKLGDSAEVSAPAKGYLAVYQKGEKPAWPAAKALSPAVFVERGNDRFVFAMDYKAIANDPAALEALEKTAQGNAGMLKFQKDILGAMGWMTYQVALNSKVLAVACSMAFEPASEYGKVMGSLRFGKPALIGQLPAEEVLGVAANETIGDTKLYASFLDTFLGAFGADASKVGDSVAKLAKACGSDGYVSMDIEPNAAFSGSKGVDLLANLGFSMKGSFGLKDEKLFKDSVGGFLDMYSTVLNTVLQSAVEQASGGKNAGGPSFKLAFDVQKDQGAALKYDSYAVKISADGVDASASLALDAANKLLEMKVATKDGKAYLAAGGDEVAALTELAKGAAPAKPLSAVAGYQDVVSAVNPSGGMLMHLNVARLVNKLAPAFGMPLTLDEATPGLLVSGGMEKGTFVADMAMGTPEIKTYIQAALPFILGSMMGGQVPAQPQ